MISMMANEYDDSMMANCCAFSNNDVESTPSMGMSKAQVEYINRTTLKISTAPSISAQPIIETFPEKSSPSTFPFCTALNSLLLAKLNLAQALSALNNTLCAVSEDIDFTVSTDSPDCIDGVVFISSHTVYFALYLHTDDAHKNGVTVEYRRMRGDSVASAHFWTQIQTSLQPSMDPSMDISTCFPELAALPALDDIDQSDASTSPVSLLDELEITFANEECWLSSELWCLSDAMTTSPALCRDLWARQSLVSSLLDALESRDIGVVRGSMLVLGRLADHVDIPELGEVELGRLCALLQHPRVLIRKYVIRLLARLAEAKSTEWRMDGFTRRVMLQRLASFGSESTQMADEIQMVSEHMLGQPRHINAHIMVAN